MSHWIRLLSTGVPVMLQRVLDRQAENASHRGQAINLEPEAENDRLLYYLNLANGCVATVSWGLLWARLGLPEDDNPDVEKILYFTSANVALPPLLCGLAAACSACMRGAHNRPTTMVRKQFLTMTGLCCVVVLVLVASRLPRFVSLAK